MTLSPKEDWDTDITEFINYAPKNDSGENNRPFLLQKDVKRSVIRMVAIFVKSLA